MAETDENESPEHAVGSLFERAGHDVLQTVGPTPGSVDWFATPRAGFVRPKTYWRAWKRCPDDIEAALEALEADRVERHADRALAVVMEGGIPPSHSTDIEGSSTTAITFRRLALELSGLAEQVRAHVDRYERSEAAGMLLPRRGRTAAGEIPDVLAYIEAWLRSGRRTNLVLVGPPFSGRSAMIEEATYRAGKSFMRDPDNTVPLVNPVHARGLSREVLARGWAVTFLAPREFAVLTWKYLTPGPRTLFKADVGDVNQLPRDPPPEIIELAPPDAAAIESWFRERLDSPETFDRFLSARRAIPDFAAFSELLPNLPRLLNAMRTEGGAGVEATVNEWAARTIVGYGADSSDKRRQRLVEELLPVFEDAALEQFGLRQPPSLVVRLTSSTRNALSADRALPEASTWTTPAIHLLDARYPTERPTAPGEARFENRLIHHYFLARKLAREVRQGNEEILTRYQFPRDYVLLFLAILAPEVAVLVTAERSEAIRVQIENEVERRLQLTLAHALKRSAGAVRSHVKAIRKSIEQDRPGAHSHEFKRIEEEVAFQCDLAEQTRLWHEVPESAIEGLSIGEYIQPLLEALQESYPRVALEVNIPPDLRVRASRDVLREMLHCLLENAFQETTYAEDLPAPRVCVHARIEGDTVRVDILDNGPGVVPGDRERIFDLYVTTKKGGNKPLGTGMGLPIARRYAEHIGAKVEMDPDRPETCFFARFVTWRELG